MISTISKQSQYSGMQDHRYSLNANAAGDPLPLIPRRLVPTKSWSLPLHASRSSPATSPPTPCAANEPGVPASASIVTITPATPPKYESDSDGSPQHRSKRWKDIRVPDRTALYPPELSTPIPSPCTPLTDSTPISKNRNENTVDATSCAPAVGSRVPLVYTPGMPLRFSIESLRKTSNTNGSLGHPFHSVQLLRPSSSVSESLSPSSSLSSISTMGSQGSLTSTPLIRKKSGQVVRPSLKYSSSYSSRSASHLGIMSPDLSFPSSKSEPSTPLTPTPSKAVHFDKNLDRVKLFLTEQKPLAVSREGSPVDTDEGETSASGAENNDEIARFFGSISLMGDSNKKSPTKLLMQTNVPWRPSFPPSTVDVALESLVLGKGDQSILGSVLVRNIAYDKSVTARFSFDGWCTTSEINAKWKEGVGVKKEGITEWDRFEFMIWLGDLKLGDERLNSRKLELAVRYRVDSRRYEVWDNNTGRNYVATFDRPGLTEKDRGRTAPLKKKALLVPPLGHERSDPLEKIASSKLTRKSRSISPIAPKPRMALDCSAPFPTTPRKSVGLHARTRSFPFSGASPQSTQSTYGWMETPPPLPPSPVVPDWLTMFEKASPITSPNRTVPPVSPTTLGSPRDSGDDTFRSLINSPSISGNDSEENVDDSGPERRKIRRHQRGGYFDFVNSQEPPISTKYFDAPAEPATPTVPPSSIFHSFSPLSPTFLDSAGFREDRQTLVESRVEDLPMGASRAIDISSQSSASSTSQCKTINTSSAFPSAAVEAILASQCVDDASDSSSASTLLENESPPSSRSSTPSLEESDSDLLVNRRSKDRELYRDFLNRFCFFTGPGSPPSLAKTRLDDVTNMTDESSSESSTPTITPSGSIQNSD